MGLSAAAALQCPQCGLRCTRPSHLKRHLAAHLPLHQRQPVHCPDCGSPFSRSDVMLKHQRVAHGVWPVRPNGQKSCQRCADKKLKCDRQQPCARCIKLDAECSYPGRDLPPTPRRVHLHPDQDDSSLDTSRTPLSSHKSSRGVRVDGLQSAIYAASAPSTFSTSGMADAFLCPTALHPETVLPSAGSVSIDSCSPDQASSATHTVDDFRWPAFGNMAPDWLDFDILEASDCVQSDMSSLQSMQHPDTALFSEMPPHSRSYADVPESFPPLGSASQHWPFSHVRANYQRKPNLPPLSEILRGSIALHGHDKTTLQLLVELLSTPKLPKVDWSLGGHAMMPAFHLLRRAIEAYFTNFHDILPVIHVPTWELEEAPTVLLSAMACIGAMSFDDEDASQRLLALSEVCSQMLACLGAFDQAVYDDIHYLTASCLFQIYCLGSGNRLLYQNADRSRGMLISGLRGLDALRARLRMEDESSDLQDEGKDPGRENGVASLRAEWLQWRDSEQERRLAWSSFEYDCSLCTLTNRRGAVDLSELPPQLPCVEALWQASTPQAWKALISQIPFARGTSLPRLLRNLLSGNNIPTHVSSWGKRLCSQIVGRLLWDLKQMEAVWVSDFLGVKALSSAQRQMKKTLLHAFGNVASTMTHAASVSELIDHNIARLIYHYSHLYSSDDTLDLVVFILRTTATSSRPGELSSRHSPIAETQLSSAKQRLITKMLSQPRRTRRLAWHAAQIVAIADCYLVSAPCEILRVFMGYSFLLAFACYGTPELHGPPPPVLSEQQHDASTTGTGNDVTVGAAVPRLDILSPTSDDQRMIDQWIENGGPASLGSASTIENICSSACVPALSQQAQTMMNRLQNWGLADKFAKILHIFGISRTS